MNTLQGEKCVVAQMQPKKAFQFEIYEEIELLYSSGDWTTQKRS